MLALLCIGMCGVAASGALHTPSLPLLLPPARSPAAGTFCGLQRRQLRCQVHAGQAVCLRTRHALHAVRKQVVCPARLAPARHRTALRWPSLMWHAACAAAPPCSSPRPRFCQLRRLHARCHRSTRCRAAASMAAEMRRASVTTWLGTDKINARSCDAAAVRPRSSRRWVGDGQARAGGAARRGRLSGARGGGWGGGAPPAAPAAQSGSRTAWPRPG